MSIPITLELARRIADLTIERAQGRADREHPYDWTSHDSFTRYVAVLRSVTAWVAGTEEAPVVVAAVAATKDGQIWPHVASEALDWAADRAGTDHTLGRIDDAGPCAYQLSWNPGPYEPGFRLPPAPIAPTEPPNRALVSSWSAASMDNYLRDMQRWEAGFRARAADALVDAGDGGHLDVMQLLGRAEELAPKDERTAHACRLDAYAMQHGIKGWYRREARFGDPANRHRVQVNLLRTPEDGDHGRYFYYTPSPVAWPKRGYAVQDRDTGEIVYRNELKEAADAWIWANEHHRPHIDKHGEVFCVCGNQPHEAGFARSYEDGATLDDTDEGYPGWLRCGSCGLVFHGKTGEVVDLDLDLSVGAGR